MGPCTRINRRVYGTYSIWCNESTYSDVVSSRVHNKNREGECLTRTLSAKITAYVRGYPQPVRT